MDTAASQKPFRIGLFDSGVGGLTVLDALYTQFPDAEYIYFGDTHHMPYGNKSFDEITTLVDGILDWLVHTQQVDLVAVACNTSAGVLYHELAEKCSVPLVEPITPITHWLATESPFQKVGLIATPTTVASNRYSEILHQLNPEISLNAVACEGLARMIEIGQGNTPSCIALLKQTLAPLLDWGMEALVLGCTHYPHAHEALKKCLPENIPLLNPAEWMADWSKQYLPEALLTHQANASPQITLYVSAIPEPFRATVNLLYPQHQRYSKLPQLHQPVGSSGFAHLGIKQTGCQNQA